MRLRSLLLWLPLGLLTACCSESGEEASEQHQDARPTSAEVDEQLVHDTWLEAEEIWALYQVDKEEADRRFKERMVTVTGRVTEVRSEPHLSFVSLENGDPAAGDSDVGLVMCGFPASAGATLEQLELGEVVVIRGRCDGVHVTGFPVFIEGCSLVPE